MLSVLQEMLAKKVDSDNLTSMLPKGDIDSLLPMLMDMQGKLALVESEWVDLLVFKVYI